MAHATLSVEKITGEYKIFECSFGFSQNVEHRTGMPQSEVNIGTIYLEIDGSSLNTVPLLNWMREPTGMRKGEINIDVYEGKRKKIKWERGICIDYQEKYQMSGFSETALIVRLSVTTPKIEVTYENASVLFDISEKWNH
jgi:hypothetical protein